MAIDRALLKASWRSWISSDGLRVGPRWLQWTWTTLFAAALAVVFTLLAFIAFAGDASWPRLDVWARWYGKNFIVCMTVAATIHVLFDVLLRRVGGAPTVRRWTSRQRTLFFAGVPLLGLIIGWPVGIWLAGGDVLAWIVNRQGLRIVTGTIAVSLLISFVMHHFFAAKSRQYEAEKRAAEAQLRLLQGQMEPHFMFNTLATVLTLIDCDAPKAKQMLEAFIDYLRASLGKLRTGDSTLGDELAMAEAYLGLMQSRMGERLAYRIEVGEPVLRGATLPPLMLQPLVENAIHHGLECKVEGGTVVVQVRREGGSLVIDVDDDGLGECERPARRTGSAGNGVALENLRSRLAARYGNAASLSLRLRPDAGARATLILPLEATSPP